MRPYWALLTTTIVLIVLAIEQAMGSGVPLWLWIVDGALFLAGLYLAVTGRRTRT